ncbi:G protein-coupled receptor [Caenorhabditis elegans]|uniref:G protein-coupled receptor n=1 Tax=Caenorhabditis elegans TaxID=6239 RepID=A0A0S4XR90_CAEEL|nr:G protein-coupled receptor [Caenorhabditis elegans]CUV67103.1 G protein-coupled receptor [Caenorhabditis elegans]|eukprot:NP_001305190.1 Serpentine Receptor, class AB (class A-like) [Caenorhabditis elegans]
MTPYQEQCKIMESLSSSIFLRFTITFQLASSLLALTMVIVASYSLWTAQVARLFHVNVIIIFQVHWFGFFLHCSNRIVLHTIDLHNYLILDYCDMPASTTRCFVLRVQYVFGLCLVGATTIPLVIERYIATIKSSKYEQTGCALGIYMAIKQEPFMPYCTAIKQGFVTNVEVIFHIILLAQIVGRVIFQYLFNLNERLRAKQITCSLSNRYSLEQNLKSMRTLKLFANLQTGFQVIHIMFFLFLLKFGAELESSTYLALLEWSGSYPLYAIISIVALLKKAQVNKVRLKKELEVHMSADQNNYFENFNKSWN